MQFVDTHCHIHDREFFTEEQAGTAVEGAIKAGVTKLLLIGTSLQDSRAAVAFAAKYPKNCWVSIGIHPHEASKLSEKDIAKHLVELERLAHNSKVVAIGECGFDFYYNDKANYLKKQTQLLEGQLAIAKQHNLPLSFHVREAFEEFWPVFEKYSNLKGVLHSFTDTEESLMKALRHNLFIGVNGIATFTTHANQIQQFKNLPIDRILLETDAPFLTPKPKRGTINLPENVTYITKFMADLRNESVESVAQATTANAEKLFKLS